MRTLRDENFDDDDVCACLYFKYVQFGCVENRVSQRQVRGPFYDWSAEKNMNNLAQTAILCRKSLI